MVFYDIGANIGFFTMVAARLVGDKGKVFAFEPEEEALRRLRKNVERNGLTNVSVVETAVWSTAGSVLFSRCDFRFSTDRGLGKIVSSAAEANTILVPSISLDYFAINASAPHLIKCDVEGAEVEVFRGAVNLLAQYKPIVICEMHSSDKISVLRELFEGFGYQVRLLNDNRLVARP